MLYVILLYISGLLSLIGIFNAADGHITAWDLFVAVLGFSINWCIAIIALKIRGFGNVH